MAVKHVVGIGGALRSGSSTELTVRRVLSYAEERGATTDMFVGASLNVPMYAPGAVTQTAEVSRLIAALRRADAIVVGSPGYHGGISGLIKNALDYTEEMARDPLPYFSGRAVACIATAAGWQGANSTLQALRSVIHALRGWPTPLGLALNARELLFGADGTCTSADLEAQLRTMSNELISFVRPNWS